jgi:hypothetical protein
VEGNIVKPIFSETLLPKNKVFIKVHLMKVCISQTLFISVDNSNLSELFCTLLGQVVQDGVKSPVGHLFSPLNILHNRNCNSGVVSHAYDPSRDKKIMSLRPTWLYSKKKKKQAFNKNNEGTY